MVKHIPIPHNISELIPQASVVVQNRLSPDFGTKKRLILTKGSDNRKWNLNKSLMNHYRSALTS